MAIAEINKAAISDGQSLTTPATVDATPTATDRLHKAVELLKQALSDIGQEEDDAKTKGLQKAATTYATVALRAAEEAVGQEAHAGKHPYYLAALADLRYANALVKVPAEANTSADEQEASAQIVAALNEMKLAAIDYGKQPDDHPTVDQSLAHRSRLDQALALLEKGEGGCQP